MRRSVCAILLLAAVLPAFGHGRAFARQASGRCEQLRYTRPVRGAARARLGRVEGQAVFGPVPQKGEFDTAAGVCL